MMPKVIIHNIISVDGRIDGFTPDAGLYYKLAAKFEADIHLAGSRTIFDPEEQIPQETPDDYRPVTPVRGDRRPILVVPDSKGRLRNWHVLKRTPYWRDWIALCSQSTPPDYLNHLKRLHVKYLLAGRDQVDLEAALLKLNEQFDAKTVLVDSGGTLNGVLLRQGLASELSLLLSPYLVGETSPASIFRAPDLHRTDAPINLKLRYFETLKNDVMWLRYEIIKNK